MPLEDKYRAVRYRLYSLGGLCLVHSHEDRRISEIAFDLSQILGLCRGCKTLEEHAAAVAQASAGLDIDTIRRIIDRLVVGGLLRQWQRPSEISASSAAHTIGTIGIVTADRPAALRRCLESAIRNCQKFGHEPRFIVIDGSRDRGNAELNRRMIGGLCTTTGYTVWYVGTDEAARIREILSRVGRSATSGVLPYALTPGATGSNRNLLLLLTAGEQFLLLDDDVLCDTWSLEQRFGEIALCGHAEHREVEFFESRADALSAINRTDIDLLASHQRLLGRSLRDLVATAERTDVGTACGHLVSALANRGADGVVGITAAGLAGDSGTYCPERLFFSSGTMKAKLLSSQRAYDTAMKSRETYRISLRSTITHNSSCMAYCLGLDNSSPLPPFLPFGRNSDGVFGALTSFINDAAFFGHLPVGIVHDSHRPVRYEPGGPSCATGTRFSELLLSAVRMCAQSCTSRDRTAQVTALLEDLATRPLSEFVSVIIDLTLQERIGQLARVENEAAGKGRQHPSYWLAGVQEYRRVLLANIRRADFAVPSEFSACANRDDAFREMQIAFGHFGRLLQAWPQLWTAARGGSLHEAISQVDTAPVGVSMPTRSGDARV